MDNSAITFDIRLFILFFYSFQFKTYTNYIIFIAYILRSNLLYSLFSAKFIFLLLTLLVALIGAINAQSECEFSHALLWVLYNLNIHFNKIYRQFIFNFSNYNSNVVRNALQHSFKSCLCKSQMCRR